MQAVYHQSFLNGAAPIVLILAISLSVIVELYIALITRDLGAENEFVVTTVSRFIYNDGNLHAGKCDIRDVRREN